MLFICHGDEAVYVRRMYVLYLKYCKISTGREGLDWMLLSCFKPLYDKCYVVHDVLAFAELD